MEVFTLEEYFNMDIPDIEFYKTDSYSFDLIVGGIIQGGITVIAGGTGQGKSMVGLHLASLLSKDNKILYLSIENAIQIDIKRFKKTCEIYDYNANNIAYINAILYEESYKDILTYCLEKVKSQEFNILVIDGADLMFKDGDDGAKMFKEGEDFMKILHKTLSDTSSSCILTWQLNRGGIMKKTIEDIDTSDIATSMGIVKYASQVYAVKRQLKDEKNPSKWFIRLIKTRTEANWEQSIMNILDEDNNINLKYEDNATQFIKGTKDYLKRKEE